MQSSTDVPPLSPSSAATILIEAQHPHWASVVVLDPASARARLAINGSCGGYSLVGPDLTIAWDAFAPDHFRLVGTRYVHLDLLKPHDAVPRPERVVPAAAKYLMVTAYYNEDRPTLERCLRSIQAQDVRTDHMVVSDGLPQAWIDEMPVRHIKLDRSHADYGNTPRGIGALLAISEGYEGIGFIDADNWLERDHVSTCINAADISPEADYVIAKWNLRRPDGTVIPMPDNAFPNHVDTNCFFFLPGSFHMIPHFSMMHKELSLVGDRVFYMAMRNANMRSVTLQDPTVNYNCLWPRVYQMAGEEPPPEAKRDINSAHIEPWLKSQTPRALEIINRRAGVRLATSTAA